MRGAALLTVLGVVIFAAFWFQRSTSSFLRIEAEAGLAERVAEESGVTAVEVMALRELLGVDVDEAELRRRATEFAAAREDLGHQDLAVLTVVGDGELALRLLADAGGDAEAAALALRPRPEAFAAVRFRAMVERFASRRPD